MKITFQNNSSVTVGLNVQGSELVLPPCAKESVESDRFVTEAFVYPLVPNSLNYISRKLGLITKRNFSVKSSCCVQTKTDCTVVLTQECKKGRFMDEYLRIVPKSNDSVVNTVSYGVWDEEKIRKALEQASKRGGRFMRLFDAFDIIGNGFTCLLILLIPFLLLWIFKDINIAFKVCSIAFIPMFGAVICINRFFDKLKTGLWKKAKGFALKNEVFEDYNSYFDDEYITSVFHGL